MPLVASLLTAIVRADGDALVLHSGERPYVVAPSGQAEIASRVLTLDAMTGMLGELLPAESLRTLDELGAVQHELPPSLVAAGEGYTVVAARGGDDIWIEIRRRRKIVEHAPLAVSHSAPQLAVEPAPEVELDAELQLAAAPSKAAGAMATSDAPPSWPPKRDVMDAYVEQAYALNAEPEQSHIPEQQHIDEAYELSLAAAEVDATANALIPDAEPAVDPRAAIGEDADLDGDVFDLSMSAPAPQLVQERLTPPPDEARITPSAHRDPELTRVTPAAIAEDRAVPRVTPPAQAEEPEPAVVLPLARNNVREQPIRFNPPLHTAGIDRLLRIAAARGASTLYLTSEGRPSIRVDGEISVIEGERILSEADVEALMLDIIPERNREALRSEVGTEWICDVPDVGRIRCVTFRDHRGAGGIFRMIPARAISAEQLGLSREIQGLCAEAEGLVLVAGPRQSGKSTLISAFVDLINRTRSDHVITLENQIKFVHEHRLSLVSQREVRGDNTELLPAARAALRENPDVLVIEDLRSPEVMTLALEAAQSGHLVIGALTAHTTTEALDRVIDQTPPERRPKMQLWLAEALRGVVAQVLLRKSGGGRVAAREVLLNTSAMANLIAEGKTSQLRMAIESGRKHGMVPLNDALASFVQSGIVDSREAFRQASDQSGFLALLKRQGIDISFVERLA